MATECLTPRMVAYFLCFPGASPPFPGVLMGRRLGGSVSESASHPVHLAQKRSFSTSGPATPVRPVCVVWLDALACGLYLMHLLSIVLWQAQPFAWLVLSSFRTACSRGSACLVTPMDTRSYTKVRGHTRACRLHSPRAPPLRLATPTYPLAHFMPTRTLACLFARPVAPPTHLPARPLARPPTHSLTRLST
jgi:hypothetical protein